MGCLMELERESEKTSNFQDKKNEIVFDSKKMHTSQQNVINI